MSPKYHLYTNLGYKSVADVQVTKDGGEPWDYLLHLIKLHRADYSNDYLQAEALVALVDIRIAKV